MLVVLMLKRWAGVGSIRRINFEWGCFIDSITSSTVDVLLLQDGWVVYNTTGHAAGSWGTTYTHIKVVVSSGTGSGTGSGGGIFASGRVQISDGALQSGSYNVASSSLTSASEFSIALSSAAPDDAVVFLSSENTGNFTADANFDTEFRWGADGTDRSVINARIANSNDEYLTFVVLSPSTGTGSGGANVTTDTAAPTSPSDGDLWFDESVGKLYVYIDGTGWVQTNGGGYWRRRSI